MEFTTFKWFFRIWWNDVLDQIRNLFLMMLESILMIWTLWWQPIHFSWMISELVFDEIRSLFKNDFINFFWWQEFHFFICWLFITVFKAFVTGLGAAELYINGAKVGDKILSPAWTTCKCKKTPFFFSLKPYFKLSTFFFR